VAKVNGTTVPVNSAADQILTTTASATGAWETASNCSAAGGVTQYSTSTHTLTCHTLALTDIPSQANATMLANVSGGSTTPSAVSIPASANGLNTDANGTPGAQTAHNIAGILTCTTSSGSATAETCTTSPSFTPASGDTFLFVPDTANSGDFTLSPNSLGAKHLWHNGANLLGNELQVGNPILLYYNGTQLVMQNNTILIASGTAALNQTNIGTATLGANTCASSFTVAGTGIVSTDRIEISQNADIHAIAGYGALTTDGLFVEWWPSAGYTNWMVCNRTGAGIAISNSTYPTINWSVAR